jgi:hypothetical protein
MPLPTRLPSPAPGTPRRRPRPGRVGALVLTAFCLAALTAVTGHAVGLALLLVATAVLGVAAALAMREHWAAAAPIEVRAVSPAAPGTLPGDDDTLTGQLRRLHATHVEKVNLALDEGREDLARELADDYTDRALELLTRAG